METIYPPLDIGLMDVIFAVAQIGPSASSSRSINEYRVQGGQTYGSVSHAYSLRLHRIIHLIVPGTRPGALLACRFTKRVAPVSGACRAYDGWLARNLQGTKLYFIRHLPAPPDFAEALLTSRGARSRPTSEIASHITTSVYFRRSIQTRLPR